MDSHRRFVERYELPFPLLADAGGKVIRAYGVSGPLGFGVRRATFLIGAFMFARGWMGGGDVKLLAALALWAGPTHFPTLILVTSAAGGVLALIAYMPGRAAMLSWVALNLRIALALPEAPRSASGRRTIPYGVAIAIGGLFMCAELKLAGVV